MTSAIDLLADRIVLAHAKDRRPDGSVTAAGRGTLDYDHYVECLRRIRFTGSVIAHGLSAEEAAGVAAFLTERL